MIDHADFFVAGGTLRTQAPSYVERPADTQLLTNLQAGEFCYVLTSRQMGKSSLMVRTARALRTQGAQVSIIDLTSIGTGSSALSQDQWYLGLLSRLRSDLRLKIDVQAWWREHDKLGAAQRFTRFLRSAVLTTSDKPLVVLIDEIDSTLNLDFRDDFFAAIRAIYNDRENNPELNRITFALFGVATPTDLIQDRDRTPFNIGRSIELYEFTLTDAEPLLEGLVVQFGKLGAEILQRIIHWTNGHPYLTQKLCLNISLRPDTNWTDAAVDGMVQELFFSDEGRKDSNLAFVQDRIIASNEADRRKMLRLYRQILSDKSVADDDRSSIQNRLELYGLIGVRQDRLHVRNNIYRQVFNEDWINSAMPTNRQARLAIFAVMAAILSVVGLFAYIASRDPIECSVYRGNFEGNDDSGLRLDALGELFRLDGCREVGIELFYSLDPWEQLNLFYDPVNSGSVRSDLVTVIRELHTTLDISSEQDRELMQAWLDRLEEFGQGEEDSLYHTLKNWHMGRELATLGDMNAAIDAFSAVIEKNEKNPVVYFDRAIAYAEVRDFRNALHDLGQIVRIANTTPPTPTPRPTASPTSTTTPTESAMANAPPSAATDDAAVAVDTNIAEATPSLANGDVTTDTASITVAAAVTENLNTPAQKRRSRFATQASMIELVNSTIMARNELANVLRANESEFEILRLALDGPLAIFNIGITNFGELDSSGIVQPSEDGARLSQWAFEKLLDQYVLNSDVFGNDINIQRLDAEAGNSLLTAGMITGTTVEERITAAARLAEQINADMMIYGNLVSNATDQTNSGERQLLLEFYLNPATGIEEDQIIGRSSLGDALPVSGSLEGLGSFATAKPLEIRVQALVGLTIGAYYDLLGDHEQALAVLLNLENDLPDWQGHQGKELLYYLTGLQQLSLGHFDEAQTSAQRALDARPGYSSAHSLLGDIFVAIAINEMIATQTPVRENIAKALAEFEAAIVSAENEGNDLVAQIARVGLASTYLLEGQFAILAGEFGSANIAIDRALEELTSVYNPLATQGQYRYLAKAYQYAGNANRLKVELLDPVRERIERIENLEAARDAYTQCIEQGSYAPTDKTLQEVIVNRFCRPALDDTIDKLSLAETPIITAETQVATATPVPPTAISALAPFGVLPIDGDDGNDFIRSSFNNNQGRVVLFPGFTQDEISSPMVFQERMDMAIEVFDTRLGTTDGAGIDQVVFTVEDVDGNVVFQRTERSPGYCMFGGGEPDCVVLHFESSDYRWPDGAEIIDGGYLALIDITSENGESTQWRVQFAIDIPDRAATSNMVGNFLPVDGDVGNDFIRSSFNNNQGRVVLFPDFTQDEISSPMVFRERMDMAVEVFDTRFGRTDGAGIDQVVFTVEDAAGNVVYQRMENSPGFCMFSGGEPNCNVLHFESSDYRWPTSGQMIIDGDYVARINITSENGESTQWRVQFAIDIPASAAASDTVRINSISELRNRYVVDFTAVGFEPTLPGQHLHFFWNTVPPEQAGVPGGGPWQLYPTRAGLSGASPFTEFGPIDRPRRATQICALVANPDHSVNQESGNCIDIP